MTSKLHSREPKNQSENDLNQFQRINDFFKDDGSVLNKIDAFPNMQLGKRSLNLLQSMSF